MKGWKKSLFPDGGQSASRLGDGIVIAAASMSSAVDGQTRLFHYVVASGLVFGVLLIWWVLCRVLRHYDVWNGRTVRGDTALTLLLIAITTVPVCVLHHYQPEFRRGIDLARFFEVLVPGILLVRATTIWARERANALPDHVLIVGIGPLGRHTGLEFRYGEECRNVRGFLRFADEAPHDRLPAEVLGVAADLEGCLKKLVISEVFIAGNGDSQRPEMQHAIGVCERFGVPFALPACGFRMGRARPLHEHVARDGYVHYLSVRNQPVQRALKRAFDLGASAVALVLLLPLMIVIAIAIKISSRGPILFKQQRVGLHGQRFNMLKFRSMVINAEQLKATLAAKNEQIGPVFKMQRDPRITAVGRIIRKYSLDELPQLINIVRGEMTIVGPRPPIPSEVAQYEAWQRRRLSVRPGLTCVWQVSGRNAISFEEWMYLDMQYIDHWNLTLDFQLILKTVPIVVTGRGAS
jgi:exopolysaccharide biosynthesis polyprenyl glycosylphosphotransferase